MQIYRIMNFNLILILVLVRCSLLLGALTNRWWEIRKGIPVVSQNAPVSLEDVPEGRIVGGYESKPHSRPYAVSLQLRFLWVRQHLCGGTLLNKYWVLTAGHCVPDSFLVRWLPLDVVAGAHDVDKLGPEAQVATVTRRITHPKYGGDIGPNDIALLQTDTAFQFGEAIQPANLPFRQRGTSDFLILSGWGVLRTTLFFPDLPGKLQEANVTYIPYEECYKAIEALREVNEENPLDKDANICTGPLTGGVAGCNGDSGGPLVEYISKAKYDDNDYVEYNATEIDSSSKDAYNEIYYDDEKIPVVIGVVSWGVSPCGQKGAPTVYTKVSNYIDFISQYVKTDE